MSVMLVNFGNTFHLDVAAGLLEKGVAISHLTLLYHSPKSGYNRVTQDPRFAGITFLEREQFTYPQFIYALNRHNGACLSAELLERFVQCENLFLSISDRLSYFPLSVQERKALYQELLLYWYTFLTTHPIQALIFSVTPHMGWDNILYEVTKQMNIPTWCIERACKDRVVLLEDFRKIEKVPASYLPDTNKEELARLIGPEFLEEIFEPSSWLKRSQQRNQQTILVRESAISAITSNFIKVADKVKFYGFDLLRNLAAGALEKAVFLNGSYRSITLHGLRVLHSLRARQRYRFYMNHTSPVNDDRPYVFVALHYQPERNVTPRGGVFEYQPLILDILRHSIPEDWTIYVKEHPTQFITDLDNRHYRSKEYYRRLLNKGENIKLVGMQENTERLIKGAMFTVTLTGSAGWQSLLQNKPCVVFGAPWYAACNSCYVVRSVEECQQAVNTLLERTPAEVELDVLKFLAYYQEKFILSSISYKYAIQSEVNYETLVGNLVTSLMDRMNAN